ncbi:transcription initiation factor TFIID subunit 9-like isoform X2 [Salvia hispanica]|uniref:transcription initiation factor TFIID subunit 9-like isoform X2 n=1 Tax=Salvia hispanica TaxID=49212 RepID=UPI002009D164|nr:transcription initiation factor TFIID subunit 9-like isoform X2 [Salvia hispanica]
MYMYITCNRFLYNHCGGRRRLAASRGVWSSGGSSDRRFPANFFGIDITQKRSEISWLQASIWKMAEGGEEDMPRDGKIVKELLRSMSIDDYEPQVVHQFLELWYQYVADVLTDAQMYSEHAEKSVIDSDDIKLAIQSKVNFSFSQPPPREVLLELARSRNKVPLPKSISGCGIPLPPDQDILIHPNYQLAVPKRQREETEDDEEPAGLNPGQNHDQSDLPQDPSQRVSFSLGAKDTK